MAIIIKEILNSDKISGLIEKINFNFDQILLAGGGPEGKQGKMGPVGPVGPKGERGSNWFLDDISNPDSINYLDGDIIVNNLDNNEFNIGDVFTYDYDSNVWINSNINLRGPKGDDGQQGEIWEFSVSEIRSDNTNISIEDSFFGSIRNKDEDLIKENNKYLSSIFTLTNGFKNSLFIGDENILLDGNYINNLKSSDGVYENGDIHSLTGGIPKLILLQNKSSTDGRNGLTIGSIDGKDNLDAEDFLKIAVKSGRGIGSGWFGSINLDLELSNYKNISDINVADSLEFNILDVKSNFVRLQHSGLNLPVFVGEFVQNDDDVNIYDLRQYYGKNLNINSTSTLGLSNNDSQFNLYNKGVFISSLTGFKNTNDTYNLAIKLENTDFGLNLHKKLGVNDKLYINTFNNDSNNVDLIGLIGDEDISGNLSLGFDGAPLSKLSIEGSVRIGTDDYQTNTDLTSYFNQGLLIQGRIIQGIDNLSDFTINTKNIEDIQFKNDVKIYNAGITATNLLQINKYQINSSEVIAQLRSPDGSSGILFDKIGESYFKTFSLNDNNKNLLEQPPIEKFDEHINNSDWKEGKVLKVSSFGELVNSIYNTYVPGVQVNGVFAQKTRTLETKDLVDYASGLSFNANGTFSHIGTVKLPTNYSKLILDLNEFAGNPNISGDSNFSIVNEYTFKQGVTNPLLYTEFNLDDGVYDGQEFELFITNSYKEYIPVSNYIVGKTYKQNNNVFVINESSNINLEPELNFKSSNLDEAKNKHIEFNEFIFARFKTSSGTYRDLYLSTFYGDVPDAVNVPGVLPKINILHNYYYTRSNSKFNFIFGQGSALNQTIVTPFGDRNGVHSIFSRGALKSGNDKINNISEHNENPNARLRTTPTARGQFTALDNTSIKFIWLGNRWVEQYRTNTSPHRELGSNMWVF